MPFHQAQLANGLQILAETDSRAHSAALGFFVRTGSRDETPELAGVSHFLEHMAFKGNDRFSAADVNRIFDEIGADSNASTSEEATIFHAAALPEYLPAALELLAALMRPSLRQSDFDVEKQVILEEIGMYDDMPPYAVYELAMQSHFQDHPLGQSVLGSTASITALTAAQMQKYHARRYAAGNLALAATGNFDWQELLKLAGKWCGEWHAGAPGRQRSSEIHVPRETWATRPALHQQHVMGLASAPSSQDPLRFAAELAAVILGDDGSGRLYWDLVETGLAESADLSFSDFDGTGAWTTFLCCTPDDTAENLQHIRAVLDEFNRLGPTDDELDQARNKVAARVVLSSERPMGRLMALGGGWLSGEGYRSVEDDLQLVAGITQADMRRLLKDYPATLTTIAGLGPLAG